MQPIRKPARHAIVVMVLYLATACSSEPTLYDGDAPDLGAASGGGAEKGTDPELAPGTDIPYCD